MGVVWLHLVCDDCEDTGEKGLDDEDNVVQMDEKQKRSVCRGTAAISEAVHFREQLQEGL